MEKQNLLETEENDEFKNMAKKCLNQCSHMQKNKFYIAKLIYMETNWRAWTKQIQEDVTTIADWKYTSVVLVYGVQPGYCNTRVASTHVCQVIN
jgi:hypothetical protein